jgi:ribose transport system ATP-binding protein
VSVPPLLEVRGIRKQFPGVKALDGVALRLEAGEVLAVVGENGAGKSTLMKILGGVYQPDEGTVLLNGQAVQFKNVAAAQRRGISLIHQELNLADNLSVAANLFLAREKLFDPVLGVLNNGAMQRESVRLLARVGLDVSPSVIVGQLAPGQKQLVEIARALSLDARVIIMDEPTSSLTQAETDRLYEVVAELKRAGVAVVYISHRLFEVQRVADRVAVLRDGQNAGELARREITHAAMVRLMVGRDLKQFYPRNHQPKPDARVRLDVREIQFRGGPVPISFQLRAGELVGMAGLVGAGRTELAEALFGIRPVTGGAALLDGKSVLERRTRWSPARAIAAGILLIPEDRRQHGLVLQQNVGYNLSLPNLRSLAALGLVRPRKETSLAQSLVQRLKVRTAGLGQTVGLLSGGNQQKVVVGKWLARTPKVLIFDEPTRGVDVGAKAEIYGLMDELAGQGVAILMISSDLEEILGMSDRVLVLHQGQFAGELARRELSEEAIMHLATGGAVHEKQPA